MRAPPACDYQVFQPHVPTKRVDTASKRPAAMSTRASRRCARVLSLRAHLLSLLQGVGTRALSVRESYILASKGLGHALDARGGLCGYTRAYLFQYVWLRITSARVW